MNPGLFGPSLINPTSGFISGLLGLPHICQFMQQTCREWPVKSEGNRNCPLEKCTKSFRIGLYFDVVSCTLGQMLSPFPWSTFVFITSKLFHITLNFPRTETHTQKMYLQSQELDNGCVPVLPLLEGQDVFFFRSKWSPITSKRAHQEQ